jgi:hypothetical protein
MPFSTWQRHLKVGEIALEHIHIPPDLFFIHWHLREGSVNGEGFLTAVAEHPSVPHSHPHVAVVIDPLTGYPWHTTTELNRSPSLGRPMSAPSHKPSRRESKSSFSLRGNSHSPPRVIIGYGQRETSCSSSHINGP